MGLPWETLAVSAAGQPGQMAVDFSGFRITILSLWGEESYFEMIAVVKKIVPNHQKIVFVFFFFSPKETWNCKSTLRSLLRNSQRFSKHHHPHHSMASGESKLICSDEFVGIG